MKQEWYPLVFGKLTVSPEGPIIRGKDHECTGKSTKLPSFVFQKCEPKVIGPGINDLTPWNEYTWLDDGGGIAFQSVVEGDDAWVVATKVRGRSESGEETSGRTYMQGFYLGIPAKDFSPLAISQFLGLQTTPMQEKDMDLSPYTIPLVDEPLSDNWIDKCEMLFESIFSGSPLSIQSSKSSISEMTKLFQHVHCAVPKALSWRIGTRIGCYEMNQEVGLAHGQRALSGLRMMGYSQDDFEKNRKKTSGRESLAQWEEEVERRGERYVSKGARYVQFLREEAKDCRHFSELIAVVKAKFPELSDWNSASIDLSWQSLAIECTDRLFELDSLSWLDTYLQTKVSNNPEHPVFQPISFVKYYRKTVLSQLLAAPLERSAPLISETLDPDTSDASPRWPSWDESWDEAISEQQELQNLSALLRSKHPIGLAEMKYACGIQLPETLHDTAFQSLTSQLVEDFRISQAAPHWVELFQSKLPQWLLTWREDNSDVLFWLSIRLSRRAQGSDSSEPTLRLAAEGHPSWQFITDLKGEASIDEESGKAWCRALPEDEESLQDFNMIADEVFPFNVAHGLQMLGWTDQDLPLKNTLESTEIYTWDRGPASALDIAKRINNGLSVSEILLRVCLAHSKILEEDIRQELASNLRAHCSEFVLSVFFSYTGESSGTSMESVAHQVIVERFFFEDGFAESVYKEVNKNPSERSPSSNSILKLVQEVLLDGSGYPPIELVSQSAQAIFITEPAPPIPTQSIPSLAWLISGQKLSNASELVGGLNGLRALRHLNPKSMPLSGPRLSEILMGAPEVFEEFKGLAIEQSWASEKGWRLLTMIDQEPLKVIVNLNDAEVHVFRRLSVEKNLSYLLLGFALPNAELSSLAAARTNEGDLLMAKEITTLQQLHIISCIAINGESQPFTSMVLALTFAMAKEMGELDKIVTQYVNDVPWYKKITRVFSSISGSMERVVSSKFETNLKSVSEATEGLLISQGRDSLQSEFGKNIGSP